MLLHFTRSYIQHTDTCDFEGGSHWFSLSVAVILFLYSICMQTLQIFAYEECNILIHAQRHSQYQSTSSFLQPLMSLSLDACARCTAFYNNNQNNKFFCRREYFSQHHAVQNVCMLINHSLSFPLYVKLLQQLVFNFVISSAKFQLHVTVSIIFVVVCIVDSNANNDTNNHLTNGNTACDRQLCIEKHLSKRDLKKKNTSESFCSTSFSHHF